LDGSRKYGKVPKEGAVGPVFVRVGVNLTKGEEGFRWYTGYIGKKEKADRFRRRRRC